MEYTCPVCGYDKLNWEPYDSLGPIEFDFCPCCNFQFGYTDMAAEFTFKQWRERWIAGGMVWDKLGHTSPPPNWNPAAQVATVMNIDGGGEQGIPPHTV